MELRGIWGEPIDTAFGKLPKDMQKSILNTMYGLNVNADGRHTEMRNEFIVLHIGEDPAIVRKSAITYVSKERENGKAIIRVDGNIYYVDEQYNEVVRRLFK